MGRVKSIPQITFVESPPQKPSAVTLTRRAVTRPANSQSHPGGTSSVQGFNARKAWEESLHGRMGLRLPLGNSPFSRARGVYAAWHVFARPEHCANARMGE